MLQSAARRRAVGFVCLTGGCLLALVAVAVTPSLPAMAAFFAPGADGTFFAQIVITAPAAMMVIVAPLTGFIAERVGRRACLLGALFLVAAGGSAGLYVSDYPTLVVTRLLLGAGAGAQLTTTLALIGEHFEGHARERLLGFAGGASSGTAVLALTVGGGLVDRLGWRAPFAFYLVALLAMPAAWYGVRAGATKVNAARERSGSVLRLWPFYLLVLILFTLGIFTPSIQLPFLLQDKGITSAAVQGSLIAVSAFTSALGCFSYGYVRRYLGEQSMYLLATSVLGTGIVAMALSSGALTIAMYSLLMGGVMGVIEPTTASALFKRTPHAMHDRAMGFLVSALYVGQFANPWVFSPLYRAFGIQGAFLCAGGALLMVAAFIGARQILLARGATTKVSTHEANG